MTVKKEFCVRRVVGETLLVPCGATLLSFNGLIALNELSAFLWERLPDAADEEALLQAVLDEYDVDKATARADIAAFLGELRQNEII
jgi:hypothetical protein